MRPFPYDFDQCDVITKSLSQNETTIRIDGFHGGNLPTYLFAGIISKEANEGSLTTSSTNFAANNVEMFNITLNGVSVNGYPIDFNSPSSSSSDASLSSLFSEISSILALGFSISFWKPFLAWLKLFIEVWVDVMAALAAELITA